MTRLLFAASLVMAALALNSALDVRAAVAKEAPWCAVLSVGAGDVVWDCHYRSVEECRPNVLAGNRGTCNQNPRYEGKITPSKARLRLKKRHTG